MDERKNEHEEDRPLDSTAKFEQALEANKTAKRVLRLYVAGNTLKSAQAIAKIREVCEKRLPGAYDLQVIDIYQQPELARSEQIIAAPTLIKLLPLPLRRIIGDLSRPERILVGLDIIPIDEVSTPDKKEKNAQPKTTAPHKPPSKKTENGKRHD